MRTLSLLALLLLSACSRGAGAATLPADPASFDKALASAKCGDTLSLAAGEYGDQWIKGRACPTPITLVSATPDKPAVLRSLTIRDVQGLTLRDILVRYTPDAKSVSFSSAVMIDGSSSITLSGVKILGGPAVSGVPEDSKGLDGTGNVIGRATARGMTITHSQDVLVEKGELANFHRGIAMNAVQKVTIRGNDIHDMRTTTMVGSNLTDVIVDGNTLHDAHPWHWGAGDHADFIAFWSDPGQKTPNARVQVTNNQISQLNGLGILGMWFQGSEDAPYTDAVISGNTFLIANLQAIALWNTHNVVIERNIMRRTGEDSKQSPSILLRDGVTGAVITDNTLNALDDQSGGKNVKKNNKFENRLYTPDKK